MASLPMVASGGKGLHWDSIGVNSTGNGDRVSAIWGVQDATPYTTLKIGKVWTDASSIGGNKYYQIRSKLWGSLPADTVYTYQVTNQEQTFDISNLTEFSVYVDCTLPQQWKAFVWEDIEVY